MNFLEELQKINAQKRIDKLAKKLRNKKVVIYGAGELATTIFENYDLSKINIVAIVDRYFQQSDIKTKFGYKCLPPNDIKDIDFDIILVANANYPYFKRIIEDLLVDLNLANSIKILPLFKVIVRSKKRNILFSLIYNFAPPVHLIDKILDFLLKNFTIFVFDKKKRKNIIHRKKNCFKTQIFGYQVLRIARSVGKGFFCGGYSSVTSNTILKERVSFNGMRIMGGGRVTIGRYFHSGIECLILSQNHNYDNGNAIPYDTTYIYKDVEIGDFVWLGSRVTILPGTKIGEGAIIQGGSVVHGEIPPYAIAGGNPAKVFKYRDIEHFEKLKAEGKFH